jgi:SOS-response transcriptional repressor LexA
MTKGVYHVRRKSQPGDPLTPRQQEILDFIREFHREHRLSPTIYDIMAHCGTTSNNAPVCLLRPLVLKGRIALIPGGRGMVPLGPSFRPLCLYCQEEIPEGPVPEAQPDSGRLITPSRRAVLDSIRRIMWRGASPSVREVCLDIQRTSNGVQQTMKRLVRDGYIRRFPGKNRGIVLVPAPGSSDCPVCRRPLPAPAEPG